MPSRRQQRCSLAIAWMTIIVAANLAGVTRARDDIADLSEDARAKPAHDHASNRRNKVTSEKNILQNSLSRLPGPDIFDDAESFADPESNAPHRRFKRVADPTDPRRMPHRHLAARRRSARRMFRRFALEESNPADESEAEYASVYDDDVDLPRASLDDELSKKRNQFEDVYPEVSPLPKSRQSPPDSLKSPVDVDDTVRKKRDWDEDGEQEEEADCADGAHEEYYYEDEAPEATRRGNNKRSSQSAVEYIDEESSRLSDRRNSDAIVERRNEKENEKGRATPLTVNARDPLRAGKIERSSVKERSQLKASSAVANIGAAKSPSSLVKRKSQRKSTKEKRPRPKTNPKPKSKLKPRPRPKKPKPRKKPKGIADGQSAKLSSDCCEENVERFKRDKTFVVKAVPKGKNVNELQIYEKANDAKKKAASMAAKDLTALPIGELKELLGKLMLKIDNLRDLISKLRNDGGGVRIEDSNEKPTRSKPQAGSCERTLGRCHWSPWSRWDVCSVTCARRLHGDICRLVSLESSSSVPRRLLTLLF